MDELLDYLIEGIADVRLRNQARLMRFRAKVELFEAFESVVLERKDSRTGSARGAGWRGDNARSAAGEKSSRNQGIERETIVGGRVGHVRVSCFKCGESGHVATRCERPAAKRACYLCGATGHLAAGCPKREHPPGARPSGSARIASTDVSRSVALPGPYVLDVNISAVDGHANYDRVDGAVIDSGSPISFIKSSSIPNELCLPVEDDVGRFHGINGSLLCINSVFHSSVETQGVRIKIKFYTVPDDNVL